MWNGTQADFEYCLLYLIGFATFILHDFQRFNFCCVFSAYDFCSYFIVIRWMACNVCFFGSWLYKIWRCCSVSSVWFFFVCRVVVSCSNAASVWSVFVCTVCPVHYIWISKYALKWRIAWIWALFIQFHLDMISVLARLTMAASFFSPFLSHPSPSSSSSPIIALLGAALVMLFMNRSLAKCI